MRRKCLATVIIAMVAAGGSVLGDNTKEAGETDLKKIQGTWQFVAHEYDGKATPPEQLKSMTITFTGDKWSVSAEGKVVQAGTQKLDPTKKPAQLDAVVSEGEGKGTTMLGIYELKSNTIRVCFDPQGKVRPTGFASKDSRFMAELKREPKKP